jgi:diadenosine tetraphosphatase ApaH/serine/threonine PP2A family protein phosphatase
MRYLVLSDIHANLPALEAVLQDAPPFDRIWCIGDVIGYGPDPSECVELLREYEHDCIAGNHDWATLGRLDSDDFNPDARRALEWTRTHLDGAGRAYLEQLPTSLTFDDFTLVHGSPRQPVWEYILYAGVAASNFEYFNTPYCFVGHTHAPAIFEETHENGFVSAITFLPMYDDPIDLPANRLIINPGSVGQPRDSDPRSSYLILDTDARTILYRRVEYPVEKTQQRMYQLGLPMRLAARLSNGW